jgi:2-polyprenyl-6-methoxyphenol hydroxylase-like FAD-dependent oxidoreductase
MTSSREHAIVVGASVAGLLAARVLSDHFGRVTVVERDELASGSQERKGVPQANHLHVLLTRGAQIIEKLFPGIGAELDAAGTVGVDVGRDFGWLGPFGWLPPFRPTLALRGCSRGLLESLVRKRVRASSCIDFLDGHEARDLVFDAGQVTGLRVSATGDSRHSRNLMANLVVEASGRGSQLSAQLAAAGYPCPEESVVDAFVGYGSCVFEGTPVLPNGWKMLYVLWSPERPRAAALLPIEGGRFMVTCVGAQRDYPPAELAGFMEYASSLRTSAVYDAIRSARPVSRIAVTRSTRNRLRHYERLTAMPRGLVAVGDAVCAFNPIYGQGMTVAALEAELLDDWLRQPAGNGNSERDFQARVAAAVAPAWSMSTGEDFRFEGTLGQRPIGLQLMHGYLDRLFRAAVVEPEIARRLVRVFLMLDSPNELLRPNIALRALRQVLRRDKVELSVPTWTKGPSRPPAGA